MTDVEPGQAAPGAAKQRHTGRNILLAIVGILAAAWVIGVVARQPAIGGPASTPPTSDAAIKAAMSENLADVAGVKQDPGGPDIAVSDGVLVVASTLEIDADTLCRSVAARTNSPDTAAPLGVIAVTIISGGQQLATCKP